MWPESRSSIASSALLARRHPIAEQRQQGLGGLAELVVVLHQQQLAVLRHRRLFDQDRTVDHLCLLGRHRQQHQHGRARRRGREDSRRAAGLGAEAVDLAQAEAGALAEALGGEERLEDVIDGFRRNSAAGVGDGDDDVLSWGETGGLCGRCVACDHQELAAAGHRIARVHRQVQQRQFELAGIALDLARRRLDAHGDADAGAERRLQDLGERRQVVGEVDHLRLDLAAAGKAQQVTGESAADLYRPRDGAELRRRVLPADRPLQYEGVVADDREQVVEVVSDAAGELAERFQALTLRQLLECILGPAHGGSNAFLHLGPAAGNLAARPRQRRADLVALGDAGTPRLDTWPCSRLRAAACSS
jgi:hypothetical protein